MGGWIGGFVNPLLAWGVALASVPLIIHLLNRQRHKPQRWAAMRFVIAAYRKTRRRVQMENLLLLLLRMAGIALLAFAAARPFTGSQSPLAGLTEQRRDVVLLVDGSASTGYRENVESVFDREIARVREILRELDAARGDRARLVLAGASPRLLSWTTPAEAASFLDTLETPTDEALDLANALGDVVKYAQGEGAASVGGALEIRLLTDLQRRSFLPRVEEAAARAPAAKGVVKRDASAPDSEPAEKPALVDQLDALQNMGLVVLVEDFGASVSDPENLGIGDVAPLGRVSGAGQPCDIGVDVRNFGPRPKTGVRVVLEVDGERRPNQNVDVPARGRAQAVFPVVFKQAGEHVLRARIDDGDHLSVDNDRFHVISVPPPTRVLLVNGAPGAVIDEDEIGYLRAVIEPPPSDDLLSISGGAPFDPREAEPSDLVGGTVDLAAFDVIWLANVESLAPDVVEKLEQLVDGGRALIVSLGDRVDEKSYDARLSRQDKTGLLPADIEGRRAVRSRAESYWRVKAFQEAHPALEFFADERFKPLFTEVPIYEFFAARPRANATVLATLDDDESHPLLIERAYGRGRVFLWTTTIDPAWTKLCLSPATLVPLVHELLRYAAFDPVAPHNVSPGSPLAAEVTFYPRSMTLVRPDGSRLPLSDPPQDQGNGRWRLASVKGDETARVGCYTIEFDGGRKTSFAVGMDAEEGDLARLAPNELASIHRALVPVDARGERTSDETTTDDRRGELWRHFAIVCLVVLVLESLWAAWLGWKRSVRR